MNALTSERRIWAVWLLLVGLSAGSFALMEAQGSTALLFTFVFIKLELIWSVFLEVGRGPRWLRPAITAATLALTISLWAASA